MKKVITIILSCVLFLITLCSCAGNQEKDNYKTSFSITVEGADGGTLECDKEKVNIGESVTFTLTANGENVLETFWVNGGKVTVVESEMKGTYVWTMRGIISDVTVKATFVNPNGSVSFDANPFSDTFGIHTDYKHPAWSWNPGIGRINWADNVIPKLAGGGIVYNGGEAIVGEYRPEHLRVVNGKAVVTPLNTGRFPDGGSEEVVPRTQTPRMLNVTLKIRDTEIARVLLPLLEAEEQRVGVKLSKGGPY